MSFELGIEVSHRAGEELQGKMKNSKVPEKASLGSGQHLKRKINKKKKENLGLSESRARQSLTGTTGTAKAVSF